MKRRTPLATLLVALALVAAGCGGGEEATATAEEVEGLPTNTVNKGAPTAGGDPAAGKSVFVKNCGSCHALADAGTNGTVGPNLDESKPDLDLTLDRVKHGKSPMPAFEGQLTEKQINDVSAYVVKATTG